MKSVLTLLALLPALSLPLACSGVVAVDDSDGDGPSGCEPVACRLYCEFGFATGKDGCEICECAPGPGGGCEDPSPAGCVVHGCPADSYCDTSQGCFPSECECDADTGAWGCTKDCVGGACVPVGGGCTDPDPSGCVSKGCPMGEICDTNLGCFPSGCACDAQTGTWGCTADCGGGVCVADPAGCPTPNPAGCVNTGCPIGQKCQPTSGVCMPSFCQCEPQTGMWSCTDDCGGGVCVDE